MYLLILLPVNNSNNNFYYSLCVSGMGTVKKTTTDQSILRDTEVGMSPMITSIIQVTGVREVIYWKDSLAKDLKEWKCRRNCQAGQQILRICSIVPCSSCLM